MKRANKRDRSVQTLFGAAAILIVLGAGNLIFGQERLSHYESLLSAATRELAITNERRRTEPESPGPNIDRQTLYIRNLKSRQDFYSLVVLGGRCMLAFAGVSLLGILLKRSIGGEDGDLAGPGADG